MTFLTKISMILLPRKIIAVHKEWILIREHNESYFAYISKKANFAYF